MNNPLKAVDMWRASAFPNRCDGCGEKLHDGDPVLTLDCWNTALHLHEECLARLPIKIADLFDDQQIKDLERSNHAVEDAHRAYAISDSIWKQLEDRYHPEPPTE